MAGKPAIARQNVRGIWLYNVGICHRLRFILLQRRLQDLRSLRLEAFAIERVITVDPDPLCLVNLPLLSSQQSLQQLVHGFPALGAAHAETVLNRDRISQLW